MTVTDADRRVLGRAVELARRALEAGDEPFGSVLTDAAGSTLFEDRNRTSGGDETRHPEFEIARWAANNLTPEQRATAVVYTSGEHCPMCSAAHAWVGLGRIVYAASATQISGWRSGWGAPPSAVAVLPITTVAPGIPVDGPVEPFASEAKELLRRSTEGR
jgi:tRNA(Arg) A34 adenosine deaminase TadA